MKEATVRYCLFAIVAMFVIPEGLAVRVSQSGAQRKASVGDQQAAASFWDGDIGSDVFSSGHSILQSHPPVGGGPGTRGRGGNGGKRTTLGGPPFKHLDYRTSATAELRKNPSLSTPEECARACREGDPPRICYYHFTLEFYTVLGAACQVCTPNATNTVWSNCQCVLADGVERGILTANRMVPGPSIQVCEGDKVVIDVENHMEGMEVTLHWHGIWQRGSQYYDGVPFVTQCPIQQGNTFRYQWVAGNAGTHFWHAHTGLQKMDGLYGSIVVRQPPNRDPNSHLYDYDLTTHVMLLSDWMHEDAAERFPGRLAVNTGQDPESLLINGKGQFRDPNTGFMTNTPLEVFTMTPGNKYRFRIINSFASVCPAQLTVQGHDLILIATDGEPVQPVTVNTIISFSGERYDFVIHANRNPGAYWIQLRGLGECGVRRVQQLAILRYARGPYQPSSQPPTYDFGIPQGVVLNPLDARCNEQRDDAICVSQLKNAKSIDPGILQEHPDVKIFLPFRFLLYTPEDLFRPNTYNRHLVAPNGDHVLSLIDEISYMAAPAPLISQYDDINPEQFCNGDNKPADCEQNCMCTHKVDVPLNAIVEIVLVDEVQQPNLSHPFHLHGYSFNVIGIGRSPDRNVKKINLKHALDLDRQGLLHRQFNLPPSKDTIAVPNNGYVVLRLRADNPGFWLFHCHFLFHIVIGMNLVLQVGTHADLPPVPPGFPTCGDHLPPISLDPTKVLNPLDAICNKPRKNAICVNQLKNAKKVDEAILQERPDVKIFLPFKFFFYKPEELFRPNVYDKYLAVVTGDHVVSLIDEISYRSPPAPPLSQLDDLPLDQFCNGDNRPEDCDQNCMCTHQVDIPLNAIVEVVLVDEVQAPNLSHPFHLHGYSFTVVGIGRSPDTNIKKINLQHALDLDRRGLLNRHFNLPPFKDTIAVPNNGYVILRFRADNPGFWLFHCHFLFHVLIGMNLIIHVGTQSDLPPVPKGFPKCGHFTPPIRLGLKNYYDNPYHKQVLNPLDAICNKPRKDAICVSQLRNAKKVDEGLLQDRPDVKIFLPFKFLVYQLADLFKPHTYKNFLAAPGGDHVVSLIDEISYRSPPAPPLSQIEDIPPEQFCNGDNKPETCDQNCMCTHKVDLPLNAIVEVVLVDEVQAPNLSHPFHLHGYSFVVVGIGRSPDTNIKKINLKHALDLDRRGLLHRHYDLPPFKDTIAVPNNGYVIMRFRADNPGYWLFHCHFLFHVLIGMNLILHVGSKADLPPVPKGFPRCGDFTPPISTDHFNHYHNPFH